MTPLLDEEAAIAALRLLVAPGTAFELRVLGGRTMANDRKRPYMGFWSFDQIPAAVAALKNFRGWDGAYYTLNPLPAAIVARTGGRMVAGGDVPGAADGDISRRRWLLIDIDAKRDVAGISATQAEKAAAEEMGEAVADWLQGEGWPEAVEIDSGNGRQLLFPADLPNDDQTTALCKRVLERVAARFPADAAHVDLSVFNAARIARLPGTLNCKGADMPERPWRMARILHAPANPRPMTADFLAAFAPAPVAPVATAWTPKDAWGETPSAYIAAMPSATQGENGSAALFKVAHALVIGFGMEPGAAAELIKREYNPRCVPPWSDAEIAHKIADVAKNKYNHKIGYLERRIIPAAPVEEPEPEEPIGRTPWRDVTDADAWAAVAGTELGEAARLFASPTEPELPPSIAITKAVVFAGLELSGARTMASETEDATATGVDRARLSIATGEGQVANVYAIIAGKSASGKDIGNLLRKYAEQEELYLGSLGSGPGIADALCERGNGLMLISELQPWLDKESWESRASAFLTDAFSSGSFRQRFSGRGGNAPLKECPYAFPNICANVQPSVFARIVDGIDIDSGFLGRFLLARAPDDFYGFPRSRWSPGRALSGLTDIGKHYRQCAGSVDAPDKYYMGIWRECFADNAALDPRCEALARRLTLQYFPRIALMLSLRPGDRAPYPMRFRDDAWERAATLCKWYFAQAESLITQVWRTGDKAADENERRLTKFLQNLQRLAKRCGADGFSLSTISRNVRGCGDADMRRRLLAELVERGKMRETDGRFFVV